MLSQRPNKSVLNNYFERLSIVKSQVSRLPLNGLLILKNSMNSKVGNAKSLRTMCGGIG